MFAETSLMLFGFGRRKDPGKGGDGPKAESKAKAEPKRSPLSGLRSGVSDEVHGGHLDGDALVLSNAFGGGRYPVREAGQWVSDDDSGYRLVFQPIDMMGRRTGPLMVTTNLISRLIVERVCGSDGLSGMLSVYAPDRRLALEMMAACGVDAPLDYSFTADIMDSSAASLRRRRWDEDRLTGPMCLYGPFLSREGFDSDGELPQRMDFTLGFHNSGSGTMALSSDLGDVTFRPSPGASLADAEPGTYRLLIDPSRAEGSAGEGLIVTDAPVPREVALNICSDILRQGVLMVYTPERDDALSLMTEALKGKRPSERTDVHDYGGLSYFEAPIGRGINARAVYGRPRGV